MNSLAQRNPNQITRWDPFRELEDMHNRLTSIFDRSPLVRRGEPQESLWTSEWSPLVDISETDKTYSVKVELPEMKREDIKVSVENGVLSISGERKFEKEENGKKFHRVERSYGSFVRSFTLPTMPIQSRSTHSIVTEFSPWTCRNRSRRNRAPSM